MKKTLIFICIIMMMAILIIGCDTTDIIPDEKAQFTIVNKIESNDNIICEVLLNKPQQKAGVQTDSQVQSQRVKVK